ncbi:MAG: HEAT repeat domain-containing protein [Promethearchaeota archaeon]
MPPSIKKLGEKLQDQDPREQIKALKTLGNLRSSESVDSIIKLLTDDQDYDVQIECIKSLGKIQEIQSGDKLLNLIDHEDIPILMEVVIALGKLIEIGFTKGLADLEEKLNHTNYRVRKFTIDALSTCGGDSTIEKLFLMLQNEDLSVEMHEQITMSIGKIGGSRAIEILQKLLIPSDLFPKLSVEVRRAAIKALGQNKKTVALEILGKIYNDKKEVKIIRNYAEEAIKMTISGAKEYYLQIRERAENILRGK